MARPWRTHQQGYRLSVLVVWSFCFRFRGFFVSLFSQKESTWRTVRRLYTCGQTPEGYMQELPFFSPPLILEHQCLAPSRNQEGVSTTVMRQKARQTSRAQGYLRKKRLVSKPVAERSTFKPSTSVGKRRCPSLLTTDSGPRSCPHSCTNPFVAASQGPDLGNDVG